MLLQIRPGPFHLGEQGAAVVGGLDQDGPAVGRAGAAAYVGPKDFVTPRKRPTPRSVRAVVAEIGAARTAIRLSPGNPYNDIDEPAPAATYSALVQAIEPFGLACLHLVEVSARDRALTEILRRQFHGTLVLNPASEGQTGPEALTLIEEGEAGIVSYGVLFLADPDLPGRLRAGGRYDTPDATTFYGGGHRGYTDYPVPGV